jgi:protein-tyrosine-phosphatase
MGSATINPDITDVSDVAYIPVPSLNFLSSWFGSRPALRAYRTIYEPKKKAHTSNMNKVIFVCRGNVARSQMAEALYKKYSGLDAISVGTKVPQEGPGKEGKHLKDIPVAEPVVRCLKENENIDASEYRNKQITEQMTQDADKIIIMAERETVPPYLTNHNKSIFWDVEDPLGKSYEEYCQTMKQIKELVLELINSSTSKV